MKEVRMPGKDAVRMTKDKIRIRYVDANKSSRKMRNGFSIFDNLIKAENK